MNSNEALERTLDIHMIDAYSKCLSEDYDGALTHFNAAVDNCRQSEYALRSRVLVLHMLGRKQEALEDIFHAASEHTNFARARREQIYPFTRRSQNVFERILCALIPMLQIRQSVLTGTEIEVRDEVAFMGQPDKVAEVVSALPAFCRKQIESTVSNQLFHAAATIAPIISWTGGPANEVALTLQLRAIEFGVHGCLGGNNTDDVDSKGDAGSTSETDLLGFVVYDVQVETSPGELLRSDCKLWTVRPGDEHNTHPVQHTETTGFTAAANVISPTGIPTATIRGNYSEGVTTASSTFGWSKSFRGMATSGNQQGWLCQWTLNSYKGGKEFSSTSCVGVKIPQLPFPDPCNVNYPSLYQNYGHEAVWRVPLQAAERLNYKFDFKITIQAEVALVPRWRKRDIITSPLSPPLPFKDTVSISKVFHCEFLDSVEKRVFGEH